MILCALACNFLMSLLGFATGILDSRYFWDSPIPENPFMVRVLQTLFVNQFFPLRLKAHTTEKCGLTMIRFLSCLNFFSMNYQGPTRYF